MRDIKPQGLTLTQTDANSEKLPTLNKFALASPQEQSIGVKITNMQNGLNKKTTPKQLP